MHAGEKKVHEVVNNMWRWDIKEYGETNKKSTKAKEGKKGLRGEIKGAESAQVQHQNIEGEQSEEEKG